MSDLRLRGLLEDVVKGLHRRIEVLRGERKTVAVEVELADGL